MTDSVSSFDICEDTGGSAKFFPSGTLSRISITMDPSQRVLQDTVHSPERSPRFHVLNGLAQTAVSSGTVHACPEKLPRTGHPLLAETRVSKLGTYYHAHFMLTGKFRNRSLNAFNNACMFLLGRKMRIVFYRYIVLYMCTTRHCAQNERSLHTTQIKIPHVSYFFALFIFTSGFPRIGSGCFSDFVL